MLSLGAFNRLPAAAAEAELLRCCGSRRWAREMTSRRPFPTLKAIFECADQVWNAVSPDDWHEAFSHHPRIGDVAGLRAKFASTASWATDEQKGTQEASEATLQALAQGNLDYEKKFGHIFLVCATGKTADELLALLRRRLGNNPNDELRVAACEQGKITKLRLEKLIQP